MNINQSETKKNKNTKKIVVYLTHFFQNKKNCDVNNLDVF